VRNFDAPSGPPRRIPVERSDEILWNSFKGYRKPKKIAKAFRHLAKTRELPEER
jgi:hypothetical protein